MEYKSLQIDKDVYEKLVGIAEDDGKKIKQEVREMVDFWDAQTAANRLLFSSDPDIVSKVFKAWMDKTHADMVQNLEKGI